MGFLTYPKKYLNKIYICILTLYGVTSICTFAGFLVAKSPANSCSDDYWIDKILEEIGIPQILASVMMFLAFVTYIVASQSLYNFRILTKDNMLADKQSKSMISVRVITYVTTLGFCVFHIYLVVMFIIEWKLHCDVTNNNKNHINYHKVSNTNIILLFVYGISYILIILFYTSWKMYKTGIKVNNENLNKFSSSVNNLSEITNGPTHKVVKPTRPKP